MTSQKLTPTDFLHNDYPFAIIVKSSSRGDEEIWQSVTHYAYGMMYTNPIERGATLRMMNDPGFSIEKVKINYSEGTKSGYNRDLLFHMRKAIIAKLTNNKKLRMRLYSLGNELLYKPKIKDTFFGVGEKNKGENEYGKLLSFVRNEMMKNEKTTMIEKEDKNIRDIPFAVTYIRDYNVEYPGCHQTYLDYEILIQNDIRSDIVDEERMKRLFLAFEKPEEIRIAIESAELSTLLKSVGVDIGIGTAFERKVLSVIFRKRAKEVLEKFVDYASLDISKLEEISDITDVVYERYYSLIKTDVTDFKNGMTMDEMINLSTNKQRTIDIYNTFTELYNLLFPENNKIKSVVYNFFDNVQRYELETLSFEEVDRYWERMEKKYTKEVMTDLFNHRFETKYPKYMRESIFNGYENRTIADFLIEWMDLAFKLYSKKISVKEYLEKMNKDIVDDSDFNEFIDRHIEYNKDKNRKVVIGYQKQLLIDAKIALLDTYLSFEPRSPAFINVEIDEKKAKPIKISNTERINTINRYTNLLLNRESINESPFSDFHIEKMGTLVWTKFQRKEFIPQRQEILYKRFLEVRNRVRTEWAPKFEHFVYRRHTVVKQTIENSIATVEELLERRIVKDDRHEEIKTTFIFEDTDELSPYHIEKFKVDDLEFTSIYQYALVSLLVRKNIKEEDKMYNIPTLRANGLHIHSVKKFDKVVKQDEEGSETSSGSEIEQEAEGVSFISAKTIYDVYREENIAERELTETYINSVFKRVGVYYNDRRIYYAQKAMKFKFLDKNAQQRLLLTEDADLVQEETGVLKDLILGYDSVKQQGRNYGGKYLKKIRHFLIAKQNLDLQDYKALLLKREYLQDFILDIDTIDFSQSLTGYLKIHAIKVLEPMINFSVYTYSFSETKDRMIFRDVINSLTKSCTYLLSPTYIKDEKEKLRKLVHDVLRVISNPKDSEILGEKDFVDSILYGTELRNYLSKILFTLLKQYKLIDPLKEYKTVGEIKIDKTILLDVAKFKNYTSDFDFYTDLMSSIVNILKVGRECSYSSTLGDNEIVLLFRSLLGMKEYFEKYHENLKACYLDSDISRLIKPLFITFGYTMGLNSDASDGDFERAYFKLLKQGKKWRLTNDDEKMWTEDVCYPSYESHNGVNIPLIIKEGSLNLTEMNNTIQKQADKMIKKGEESIQNQANARDEKIALQYEVEELMKMLKDKGDDDEEIKNKIRIRERKINSIGLDPEKESLLDLISERDKFYVEYTKLQNEYQEWLKFITMAEGLRRINWLIDLCLENRKTPAQREIERRVRFYSGN